ncbi:MAG: CNNM domain-containing protein [Planctomycetaceae bacterium]
MNALWESSGEWLPGVLTMGTLGLGSSFFSGSETALFFLSRDELRAMQVGAARQRAVARLMERPDRLLTAILFWNLLINLMFFAVSVVVGHRLVSGGHTTAAGLLSVLTLVGIIVFGEVLPKSVAVMFPRRLSEVVVWPLTFAVRALDPIMPTLATITGGIRRALYPNLKREPFLDADDLEKSLESLPAGQHIVPYERSVLHRVLDLSETTAEEMMRPRGSYNVWAPPVSLDRIRNQLKQSEYILIQDVEPESIRGAISLSSLTYLPNDNLENLAMPVEYVPWCAKVADVLDLLQERLRSLAVVVSEYGEAVGILTEEDILDSIFAPQPSRGRRLLRREPVLSVGEGKWHVEGITTLRYLASRLGLDYDPDEDDSITVGGLMQEEFERLPQVGDECEWLGFHLRVFEIPQPKQLRVVVSRERESSSDAPAAT